MSPTPHDNRLVAGYNVDGAGTTQNPASVSFSFGLKPAPGVEIIRAALPETVTIEENHGSLVLKGVDPTMSRLDISLVFYDLADHFNWKPRHFA